MKQKSTRNKEVFIHGKNDISAQEASEGKGTRLPRENGYQGRQKGPLGQKSERQKRTHCLSSHSVQSTKASAAGRVLPVFCSSMESLRKNQEFIRCYKAGKPFHSRLLTIYVLENGKDSNRIGISVSKKVGGSVVRHRVKRLVKESYRLHEDRFNSGLDLAVVARRQAAESDYHEIESALLYLMKKAGLLKKQEDAPGEA